MEAGLKDKILNTVHAWDLLEDGQHIVVGLSGGPDSVCLFHFLDSIARERSLVLHAVHVNHQLRPGDAEADQAYVEALCAEYGWSLDVLSFDCAAEAERQRISPEEAGRRRRYQAFTEAAERLRKDGVPAERIRIAVAHHADDQAETILFRILRGTGTDGLAGMSCKRRDAGGYLIIRPLLDCTKAEIQEYCRLNGLEPRIDRTNDEPLYARNRIRLELIPYLEQYNPGVRQALIRLGGIARTDSDYFDKETADALETVRKETGPGIVVLDGRALGRYHKAIRTRVLRKALQELGLTEDYTYRSLEAADGLLSVHSPSARIDLPHGYRAVKVYGNIRLEAPAADGSGESYPPAGFSVRIVRREQPGPGIKGAPEADGSAAGGAFGTAGTDGCRKQTAVFDADEMAGHFGADFAGRIRGRYRSAGDFIAIRGGRKKIQDLFVDQKVPKAMRDRIPFAAIGSEVLFIPAHQESGLNARYSAAAIVKSKTKVLLIIEYVQSL